MRGARRPGAIPLASFSRSFSTTRTNAFPLPFFRAPQRPSGSSSPSPSSSSVSRLIPKLSRSKWSFARNGFISESFATNHPWIASLIRIVLASAIGLGLLIAGILLHDTLTYAQRRTCLDVPVHPLSIHPRRGGPKNLPIIELDLDDEEDAQMKELKDKPRVVILGGGWGVGTACFFSH